MNDEQQLMEMKQHIGPGSKTGFNMNGKDRRLIAVQVGDREKYIR